MSHFQEFSQQHPEIYTVPNLKNWVEAAMAFEAEAMIRGAKQAGAEEKVEPTSRRLSFWYGMSLLAIYWYHKHNPSTEWCHLEDLWHELGYKSQNMRDATRLKHWGFIEGRPKDDAHVKQGYWKITWSGRQFIEGAEGYTEVYAKVWTLNDQVVKFGGELITIAGILKSEPFNIVDLMMAKHKFLDWSSAAVAGWAARYSRKKKKVD